MPRAFSCRYTTLAMALVLAACGAPKPSMLDDGDSGSTTGSENDAGSAPDAGVGSVGDAGFVLESHVTGQRVTGVATADAGLHLVLTTPSHTYVFDVPSEAVTSDVTIAMEEATSTVLPTANIVRFSPDGLVFARAAMLISDRTYDRVLVGLQFRADGSPPELHFASPRDAGTALVVTHFSDAVIGEPDELAAALTDEQRADIAAVNSRLQASGRGLADRYLAIVEPEIERAQFREHELARAITLLSDWKADVQIATAGDVVVGNLPGTPTLTELGVQGEDKLVTNGLKLFAARTKPRCEPGRDVFSLIDWASVPHSITADLQRIGTHTPANELCVAPALTLTGPATLAEADDTITVTATFELTGPNGEREPAGKSVFNFSEVGATEQPNDNQVPSLTGVVTRVFSRLPAKRLSVQLSVTALTTDTQLGGLPAPAPAELNLQEPYDLTLTATPTSVENASQTSVICATAHARGQPLTAFETKFSLMGDGALSTGNTSVVASNGQACTTYTAPSAYPMVDQVVTVRGDGLAQGARTSKQQSVLLTGSAPVIISGTPSGTGVIELVSGASQSLCVTATQGGQPRVGDVVFTLTGPGSLSTTMGKTGSSPTCTVYQSPTTSTRVTPSVETTVTLNGVARAGPLFSIGVSPNEYTGTLAYSDSNNAETRASWSNADSVYRTRIDSSSTIQLDFSIVAKKTNAGAGTPNATGYVVNSVDCSAGSWASSGHIVQVNNYDYTVSRSGVVSNCRATFLTQYPTSKSMRVTFDVTETAVTAGDVGNSGSVVGTTMNTQTISYTWRYTEGASALTFDATVTDEDVPAGSPPSSYTKVKHLETVSGSLSQ